MNCITACRACNGHKGNRLPEEARMSLHVPALRAEPARGHDPARPAHPRRPDGVPARQRAAAQPPCTADAAAADLCFAARASHPGCVTGGSPPLEKPHEVTSHRRRLAPSRSPPARPPTPTSSSAATRSACRRCRTPPCSSVRPVIVDGSQSGIGAVTGGAIGGIAGSSARRARVGRHRHRRRGRRRRRRQRDRARRDARERGRDPAAAEERRAPRDRAGPGQRDLRTRRRGDPRHHRRPRARHEGAAGPSGSRTAQLTTRAGPAGAVLS